MSARRSTHGYPSLPARQIIAPQRNWRRLILVLVLGLFLASLVLLLTHLGPATTEVLPEMISFSSAEGRKEWSHSRLVVRSNVPGAQISIDGRPYGTTWVAVKTTPGTHTVGVVKKGFKAFQQIVELRPDKVAKVEAQLKRLTSVKHSDASLPAVENKPFPRPRHPKSEDPAKSTVVPDSIQGSHSTLGRHISTPDTNCPDTTLRFGQWLQAFKSLAQDSGISRRTIKVFDGITLNQNVLRQDRHQSEYTKTFFNYLNSSISSQRIKRGQRLLKKHARSLAQIKKKYGVPPEIIVSLWGMETSYGSYMGDFSVIKALTTLAYQGRRSEFFCSELLSALRMIDAGQATTGQMVGSWAGAMGQPQFMPSTFLRYAADGDGDGRIDIWRSRPDVFESAANYLFSIGWKDSEIWGREVLLPPTFDPYEARLSNKRHIDEWRKLGVLRADGGKLPSGDISGSIILPAGVKGPAFLAYSNFYIIMEWNRSLNYALTVAHLADRLAGKGLLKGKAPADDHQLRRNEVIAMQKDLNILGFDAGEPDGMIGMQSRAAIRKFQRRHSIPADAYATPTLIATIRREVRHESIPTSALSKSEIIELQRHLTRLGFYGGTADGKMGPQTRRAIGAYQLQQHIPETGFATTELLDRIAAEADLRVTH